MNTDHEYLPSFLSGSSLQFAAIRASSAKPAILPHRGISHTSRLPEHNGNTAIYSS